MINYQRIRPEMIEALKRYVEYGIMPGGFLTAVLENNLTEAVGRADDGNQRTLADIVAYVYNEIPSPAWGSPERVAKWVERVRNAREAEEVNEQA